ncbi:MAG: copper chaperone PCu(A)C [Gemmatimonadaceae bacterium]|jgi:hypothetical protein|nr:copper chaperone PCu(A)C [Gemmatimonadaceae bacterium]
MSVAACRGTAEPSVIEVRDAWARPCLAGTPCGVYATLINRSDAAVEVVSVRSPRAATVELHESMVHDGQAHMMAHPTVSIPARGTLDGRPGKWHLMLLGVSSALVVGDSIPLTFAVRVAGGRDSTTMVSATAIVRAP